MVLQKPKYCKNFERNSHWRKLSMIMAWMVWERYCNTSPKPEFFLFSLFIFSFISQLIWNRLGWNFHRWFSIQKRVNWCTIDPFALYFCTSQHSYPVPLNINASFSFDKQGSHLQCKSAKVNKLDIPRSWFSFEIRYLKILSPFFFFFFLFLYLLIFNDYNTVYNKSVINQGNQSK